MPLPLPPLPLLAVALIDGLLTYALPASARGPTATTRVWESCTLGSIPVLSLTLLHYPTTYTPSRDYIHVHTSLPSTSTSSYLTGYSTSILLHPTGRDYASSQGPPPRQLLSSSRSPNRRPALASSILHHVMRLRPTGEAVISLASRPLPPRRQPASRAGQTYLGTYRLTLGHISANQPGKDLQWSKP